MSELLIPGVEPVSEAAPEEAAAAWAALYTQVLRYTQEPEEQQEQEQVRCCKEIHRTAAQRSARGLSAQRA
jgi:hypothetical protein